MNVAMSSQIAAPLEAIRREVERRCVTALNAGAAPDPTMHRAAIMLAAAERFDDEPDAIECSEHASFYATLLIDRNLDEGFTHLVAARAGNAAPPAPSMDELAPFMARADARLRSDPGYAAQLRVPLWPLAEGLDRLTRLLAKLARNPGLVPAVPEPFATRVIGDSGAAPARVSMRIDPIGGAIAACVAIEGWQAFADRDVLLLPASARQEAPGDRSVAPLARQQVNGSPVHLHAPLPAAVSRGLPPRDIPLPPAARFCFDLRFHHDVPTL